MTAQPEGSAQQDPLEPVLRDVEDKLHRRLREACDAEAQGISSDSTAEIRRLEDSLLAAAVAAEESITIRRHIERRKVESKETNEAPRAPQRDRGRADESTFAARESGEEQSAGLREFRDAEGQLWRAWPVTPGRARAGSTTERYLGDYHQGWICFESLEGSARRRLPRQLPRWSQLDDAELAVLLDEAISAPKRKPRPGSPET